jgi:hypothetical protein
MSSILCWDMVNIVLRVWLQMVDTTGRQKENADWDLQEASIKILRCVRQLAECMLDFDPWTCHGRQPVQKLASLLLHDNSAAKSPGVKSLPVLIVAFGLDCCPTAELFEVRSVC